jgi:putative oxidoreductase
VKTARDRLVVPALAPLYDFLGDYAWPVLRIMLGLWLCIGHGYPKLFGTDAVSASRNFVAFGWAHPLAWAYFIGIVETLGGLMLAIGLGTRLVAIMLAIELFVVSFAVLYPIWSWGKHGMEYSLMMAILALTFFFRGGGRLSVDRLLPKEL